MTEPPVKAATPEDADAWARDLLLHGKAWMTSDGKRIPLEQMYPDRREPKP